jgi:hypothetical protein
MIEASRLHEIFTLSDDGRLFRKLGGQEVGTKNGAGYVVVRVGEKVLYVHRIAWAMTHGSWPIGSIDHINCTPSDNRPCNLRQVCQQTNAENQRRPQRRNAIGLLGVTAKRNKFRATIVVNGKQMSLGAYSTPEQAHAAYVAAKRIHHKGCTL